MISFSFSTVHGRYYGFILDLVLRVYGDLLYHLIDSQGGNSGSTIYIIHDHKVYRLSLQIGGYKKLSIAALWNNLK